MLKEIEFDVEGYPPAKGEALSMLGARHSHAPRVLALLEAAMVATESSGLAHLGAVPLGMEFVVSCRRDHLRSDATNYLGGVADVLEDKAHRGQLEHLGSLAKVGLFNNDRQLEEVRYRWESADQPSYRVRLWALVH